MRISANMATIERRKHLLPKVISSIVDQVDVVRIWANDYTPDINYDKVEVHGGKDLTDNGKFAFLPYVKDEMYFTIDDDLLYPDNYVQNTLHYLKKYPNHYISYHGRKLLGKGRNYYRGHKQYHCLRTVNGNWEIDVPGTGVGAFHTDLIQFDPIEWEHNLMSDLMVGRELAKKGIPALCVQHKIWWLKNLLSQSDESIYKTESKDCTIQNKIADEIVELNGLY